MKTVFDKSTVAHYWANQRQQTGRVSASNFYFEGRTIYSYGSHFPIATISAKDSHVVLFTTRSYSNTTAKHISEARMAASHKEFIYCKHPKLADEGEHAGNINSFEDAAKDIAAKLPRATKPEKYLLQIAEQKEALMKYVNFFGIKPLAYKHLKYIHIVTKEGATEATEKERKTNELANKKRQREIVKRNAELLASEQERLKKWRSFKLAGYNRGSSTIYLYRLTGTYLRYNKADERIETSKGVEIPLTVAERFYKWLKKTLANGGCDGNCKREILGYEVKTVNSEGVVIGCHNIEWSEINTMAKKLKWS